MNEYGLTSHADAYAAPAPGFEYVSPAPAGTCAAPVSNSGVEENDVNGECNSEDEANEDNGESDSEDGANDVTDESNSGDEANDEETEDESTSPDDGCTAPTPGNGEEAHTQDLQWSTHVVDVDCEHLLDRVYDAVRNGQWPYELQRDGWFMGEIREAVGIWYKL